MALILLLSTSQEEQGLVSMVTAIRSHESDYWYSGIGSRIHILLVLLGRVEFEA